MHDVCAVIVSRSSDRHQLETCTSSLLARTGPIDLDLILVDIGSGRMADYVDDHLPHIRTIRCPERSAGYAFNRALETANARYHLFLAPDVELLEGSLSQLTSALDSFPKIAAAGIRQLRADGRLAPSIGRFPSTLHMLAEATGFAGLPGARRFLGELMLAERGYKWPSTCDWAADSLMLVRTSALEDAGWFDERLFFSEDIDLCWRLHRLGWEVAYLPCMTVRNHQHDRLKNTHRESLIAYSRMQFARKHFPKAAAEYRWALALRYALRVVAYSLRGRHENHRRRAARGALDTVLSDGRRLDGWSPL